MAYFNCFYIKNPSTKCHAKAVNSGLDESLLKILLFYRIYFKIFYLLYGLKGNNGELEALHTKLSLHYCSSIEKGSESVLVQ